MQSDLGLMLAALFSVAFGVVTCFAGYRIFRLVLSIVGFIIGASIGLALASGGTQLAQILIALFAGIIGAIVMNALYFVGVVIAGALLGALLASILAGALGMDAGIVVLAAGAVVGGVVALLLNRLMVILSTAFGGAAAIVYGVSLLFPGAGAFAPIGILPGASSGEQSTALLAVWIVLGVIGFAVQYRASEESADQTTSAST